MSAKGRARLFKGERLAKELDPESEIPLEEDNASDSDISDTAGGADTEHYLSVGQSKLRQKQAVSLGPAYRGTRVSRQQLEEESEGEFDEENDDDEVEETDEEEEFDDPEDADVGGAEVVDDDNDGEIDSDDAFGASDEELVQQFTFRGSSRPRENKEDEDDEDDDDDDNGVNEDMDEVTAQMRAETRKILAAERQRLLAPISQSAKADVDKGLAVRKQRRAFDALLNMRIRLQKALVASNSLHLAAAADESASTDKKDKNNKKDIGGNDVDSASLEQVMSKAVGLLETIQDIRQSFYADGGPDIPEKREKEKSLKRRSCQDIFDEMAEAEEAAMAKRRKVLDRWSARVQRPSTSTTAVKRFSMGMQEQSLALYLDGQLASMERFVQRTRVPRSCAPVQSSRRVAEDAEVFDDADFYQMLLKELVDQRTADAAAGGGVGGGAVPTVRWAGSAAKEAKTRKVVDRKASKGRKMRFNVHEKLQNFMAPEDRRDWEPEAIDRLFGALFGQRTELREEEEEEEKGADEDDGSLDGEHGGASLEEESLRLFRS